MSVASAIQQLFGGTPANLQRPMTPAQAANPNNAASVPPVNPAPTGNVNPAASNGTNPSPTGEGNGVVPLQVVDPNVPASPLDSFKDLWHTDPVDPASLPKPMFDGVTPQKLAEQAKKVDFTKSITPENLAAIQKGGPEALAAMVESMGHVAQTVYAQSAYATTQIVAKAVKDSQAQSESNLPDLVKRLSVREGLRSDNPILKDPALAPIITALETQMTLKNPNASAQDIQDRIGEYLLGIGKVFQPADKTPKPKVSKNEDWDSFA